MATAIQNRHATLEQEFNRQLETLLQKDYPALAGVTIKVFKKQIEPLKDKLADVLFSEVDLVAGKLPLRDCREC